VVVVNSFPKCQKCDSGGSRSLSGLRQPGAAIYKAWACTNPSCGFIIRSATGTSDRRADLQRRYSTPRVSAPNDPRPQTHALFSAPTDRLMR
jgi:hypothetical protein